ncbi:MAG: ATP-binding protein [Acidimicrobiia bacterium]|nr:ATP-binding protein [Acidimicrobiia bacterium]
MTDTVRARPYTRRVVDDELDELIDGGAAAIAIDGAKAVGKSATAAERAQTAFLLEDPLTLELLEADPSRLVTGTTVLIDEWQRLPTTWDVVRRAVDAGARPGQFLLTGSASAQNQGTHSEAGRILKVRMRPMTLIERGIGPTTVSLADLLRGGRPAIVGETPLGLSDYVVEIVRSGFPAIHLLGERVRRAQLRGYIERVIDRDIPDATGRTVRHPATLHRWLAAYAAATATTTSLERIRDAATAGEDDKPARTTTIAYREALESLYVLDPVPAWAPTINHIAQLAAAPKHHLVDPALAAAALGLGVDALLSAQDGGVPLPRDGTFLGKLFESLVTLDLRVFAQLSESTVGHLRTHRGDREVDLIVERDDHRVVAFEVKLSASVDDDDVRHLHWLHRTIGDNLLDAAVITTGRHAYRRTDGIAVVPAALLGP